VTNDDCANVAVEVGGVAIDEPVTMIITPKALMSSKHVYPPVIVKETG
jgi:hypothetical protein